MDPLRAREAIASPGEYRSVDDRPLSPRFEEFSVPSGNLTMQQMVERARR
jgi:hypothetical protein